MFEIWALGGRQESFARGENDAARREGDSHGGEDGLGDEDAHGDCPEGESRAYAGGPFGESGILVWGIVIVFDWFKDPLQALRDKHSKDVQTASDALTESTEARHAEGESLHGGAAQAGRSGFRRHRNY